MSHPIRSPSHDLRSHQHDRRQQHRHRHHRRSVSCHEEQHAGCRVDGIDRLLCERDPAPDHC